MKQEVVSDVEHQPPRVEFCTARYTIRVLDRSVPHSVERTGARSIPDDVWNQLLEGGTVVQAAPGDALFRIGETPQPAAILSGIIRVFTLTPTGRRVIIRYAEAGELIGLVPRLGGSDAWEARAVNSASAAVLTLEHIETIGRRQPEALWAILRDTSVWTSAAISRVADAVAGPMFVRVARHLLDLALYEPDGRVVAHVSHQVLADAVGTAREVVTRTLRNFRSRGLVGTPRGSIVITDPERLARVAAGAEPPTA